MSNLYIIGNGFDIAHGIPSRYSDFRHYCELKMPEMYEKLNRYYEGGDKLWNDFENELPNLNQEALFSWATINNPNWNQNWNSYYAFIDEIRNEVDYVEGLKLYFTEWIRSISLNDIPQQYELPIDNCLYLSFNYTLTLERVYHIQANRILHIHGKVEGDFPQLVLGHNMPNQDIDETFSSDNDLEEEACKEVANLVKGWRKDTNGIITANDIFFGQLGEVTDIYVLGHSMNDVDLPYFNEVNQSVSADANWHISVFDDGDRNNKQHAVQELQIDLGRVHYMHMEDILLHREGDLFD